uniref:Pulmonary surfactant-associated protein B n=1 Tax=Anthurium amnicola TaxID=1678845 RepID=A0A1D1YNI1_9ARAE
MGTALFISAFLLLLARADGVRKDGLLSVVMADSEKVFENKHQSQWDVPPDFFCHSCQEVSRKVEKFLTDPSLYDEVDTISTEVCHILRSDLQVKCRKLVELYLHEGILFLQIIFREKNFCNSTGFCPVDNGTFPLSNPRENEVRPSIQPKFLMLRKTEKQLPAGLPPLRKIDLSPYKVRERKSCDACHATTEQIRKGLEDHEQQIKIIKSLLEACESIQNYVNQCKRLVFQYGPLVLVNLRKFLSSNDLCYLAHMCEVPVPPNGKTDQMHLSMEQPLQHLRSEV